ncbi:MAG: calmodulin [Desulfobacterales bacterium]|nr:calmodulin [Desulfobacterales bacterium]
MGEAYFELDAPPAPETFIFKLNDPEKIDAAKAILSGEEKDAVHVAGVVVKERASYNDSWSFHLDPDSIEFIGGAVDGCDSSIQGVEDNLDAVGNAFLPDNRWCSSSSRLIREIPLDKIF